MFFRKKIELNFYNIEKNQKFEIGITLLLCWFKMRYNTDQSSSTFLYYCPPTVTLFENRPPVPTIFASSENIILFRK